MTPPNVDSATAKGMSHDITPNNFCPNVWEREREKGNKTWILMLLAN